MSEIKGCHLLNLRAEGDSGSDLKIEVNFFLTFFILKIK